MDVLKIREQMPVCQQMTYVNTGWSGPSPVQVVNAIKERLDLEMIQGPTSPDVYQSGRDIQAKIKEAMASLINASIDEVVVTRNTTEGLHIVMNGLSWEEGDGIITFRYTDEEAASWRRRGTAVVNVSTEKASTPLPSVFLDNLEAGRQAARFFLERGWDSFGYLHDPHRRYSTERLDGFREVLGEHGHEVDVLEVDSSRMSSAERPEGVRDALRRQIDGWKHPVAVLTKDDISASALLRYLPEFGLSCPDDVAVIGVSNDRLLCLTSFPSLSSVRYPAHQIGYGAAGLLDRQLAGESIKPSQEVTLAPREVRERQSSTRFVSTDKLIASALEFIGREAPGRVVRVEELWERTGVSR